MVGPDPPYLPSDLQAARPQEDIVLYVLPHLEVETAYAVDFDLEDGCLKGNLSLLDPRGDD